MTRTGFGPLFGFDDRGVGGDPVDQRSERTDEGVPGR
jgi:hypothetical protein